MSSVVGFVIAMLFVVMVLIPFAYYAASVKRHAAMVEAGARAKEAAARAADYRLYAAFGLLVLENRGTMPVALQYLLDASGAVATAAQLQVVSPPSTGYQYTEDGYVVLPGGVLAARPPAGFSPVLAYVSPLSPEAPGAERVITVAQWGVASNVSTTWVWVRFPEPFPEPPVVVASILTLNEYGSGTANAAVARVYGVTRTGFWLRLEDSDGVHAPEDVVWLAVLPGEWSVLGTRIYATVVEDVASQVDVPLPFQPEAVIHTVCSWNADLVESRGDGFPSPTVFRILVEGFDPTNRIASTPEDVSIVAFSGSIPGVVEALRIYTNQNPAAAAYASPVSPVYALHSVETRYGGDGAHSRIYAISTTQVSAMLEEPAGYDGPHVNEYIDVLVFSDLLVQAPVGG